MDADCVLDPQIVQEICSSSEAQTKPPGCNVHLARRVLELKSIVGYTGHLQGCGPLRADRMAGVAEWLLGAQAVRVMSTKRRCPSFPAWAA